jgi:pyrrolidone-carboxylate peptidase
MGERRRRARRVGGDALRDSGEVRMATGRVNVVVTGFGAFRDVVENPSGRVARALDGRVVGRVSIVAAEVPVRYGAGPDAAVALAERHGAVAIIGLGRHPTTEAPRVETVGHNAGSGTDTDGDEWTVLEPDGPARVDTSIDAATLAEAIAGTVTDDAGRYVCNAWIYRVTRALGARCAVGFVHVPPAGMDPEVLLAAIGRLWR